MILPVLSLQFDGSCRIRCKLCSLYRLLLVLLLCIGFVHPEAKAEEDAVEFPDLLDADDIAYFFSQGDIDGLHWALSNVFAASERNPDPSQVKHRLPQQLVSRGGGSTYTTEYKLKMDIQQAEYLATHLAEEDRDPKWAKFFQDAVLPIYQKVLSNVPPVDQLERTHGLYAFREADLELGIGNIYNKAWHHTNFEELKDPTTGKVLPLLNPEMDTNNIEREWFGEDNNPDHHPGILYIDDVLSKEALGRIRQLLLESTVWYQTKMPLRFGGYVGAYIDDGLHDRLLLQLSMELHKALPRIMKGHPLKYLWAYKYDSEYTGINLHADEAAVNVNIWLTPDEANLDPTSGGLVVFTAKPPEDWNFAEYNTDTDRVVEELLRPTNFANVTIPHKQNRAVIFDSSLFHQTDRYKFKPGYENRRINLTILYGDMQRSSSHTTDTPPGSQDVKTEL